VEQQAASRARAVLPAKRLKIRGIAEEWSCRGLDFDRQQPIAFLDHEVGFFARGRPPVEDLDSLHACIAPRDEVAEDDVLEMRATRIASPARCIATPVSLQ
jgi:hypothetical protein